MKLSEEKSSKKGTSSSQVTPQNSELIVSKPIWNNMSPKSKYKVVESLKVSPEIWKDVNCAIHMEIGVNISNPYEISQESETIFQRELKLFFECQEVARKCPDSKKIVPHPFEKGEKILAWYRLGTIKMLHLSFEAETGVKCSSESFRQAKYSFLCSSPKLKWLGYICVFVHIV